MTLNASDKTYDGSQVTATLTPNSTWTSQGLTTPTISYSPANSKNVGTYTASATVGSATATQQFTINKRQLTLTGVTANDKVYDGTDVADLNIEGAALEGVVDGDDVQIGQITGVYDAGKAAGNGKAITVTATLTGEDADNYEVAPISLSSNITRKPITLEECYVLDKVYNGNNSATRDTNKKPSFEGLVEGDTVGVRAECVFEDKHVGTNKLVTVKNPALNGADAKNYTLVNSETTTTHASITPAKLGISGITASDKEYDGTTSASVDVSNVTYSSSVQGYQDVSINTATVEASFNDKNVGNDKPVNVTFDLQGADSGNYNVVLDTITANITPKAVTVGGISVDTRQYDKTTDAPLNTANATFAGMVVGDTLTVSGDGAYEDPNVGTDKPVSISNLVLGGADAGNYTVASDSQSEATGTITQREVTVSGITAQDKTYDGNTDATLKFDGLALNGKLDGDDLDVDRDKIVGAFKDKVAGADKVVSISGYELTGDAAGNYVLAAEGQQTETKASIGQKTITVSGITAEDRAYDGTAAAELNYDEVILDGAEDGDDLSVSATGTFSDKNAGEDKNVAITGLTLEGDDVANYVLAETGQQGGTTATITKRPVVVSGITADDKVYDGTTDATVQTEAAVFENIVDGDELTVSTSGTFEDKDAAEDKTVNLEELVLGGEDVENYELSSASQQSTATATISPKPVNVTAEAKTKTFRDPDPALTYTADALLDDDAYTGELVRETGENVGTYEIKQGTLSAGGNYEISYTPADFTITQAPNKVTVAIEGWTYGDEANEPAATADFGQDTATFAYSDAEDGEYTDAVPTDAGTWYVKATVAETPNYAGAVSDPVAFEIAPKEIGLEWSDTELTYNGEAQKPSATATGLVGEDECEVTVEGEQTDANAKTGTESYTATAAELSNPNYILPEETTTEFTIAPKPLSRDMLGMDSDMFKGDGSVQGPQVTLTDGELELVEGEDFVLTGEVSSDKMGTHLFAAEGLGNYTDSVGSSWVMYANKQNEQTEPGVDGAGSIGVFVDIIGNTEAITVDNFTVEFAKALLSKDDLERKADGEDILVYIEVVEHSAADVPDADRMLLKDLFESQGAKDLRWYDIKVWKKVGSDPATQVHELANDLQISIAVPDEYKDAPKGYTRTFYFGTAHDGWAQMLTVTQDRTVVFASRNFSTFALAYGDVKNKSVPTDPSKKTPNTGDDTNMVAMTGLALAGVLFLALARRRELRDGC